MKTWYNSIILEPEKEKLSLDRLVLANEDYKEYKIWVFLAQSSFFLS